jgi:hypothetical protein
MSGVWEQHRPLYGGGADGGELAVPGARPGGSRRGRGGSPRTSRESRTPVRSLSGMWTARSGSSRRAGRARRPHGYPRLTVRIASQATHRVTDNAGMASDPDPMNILTTRLAALGQVIESSAFMEYTLRNAFCSLVDSKYAAIVAGGQSVNWLIEQCKALADVHHDMDRASALEGEKRGRHPHNEVPPVDLVSQGGRLAGLHVTERGVGGAPTQRRDPQGSSGSSHLPTYSPHGSPTDLSTSHLAAAPPSRCRESA